MKKNILLLFAFCFLFFCGCVEEEKTYEYSGENKNLIVRREVSNSATMIKRVYGRREIINELNLYIRFSDRIINHKHNIDSIFLSFYSSKNLKDVTVNYYKIIVNNNEEVYEENKKQIACVYDEKDTLYHFTDYKLDDFELNSKDKDKITVIVNLTVIDGNKQETKTIESSFIVKIKNRTWLERQIVKFLTR